MVARTEQRLRMAVPERKREHAAQFVQHRLAPLLVAVQQDLGIRAGGEGVPGGLQLFAQGLEVVNFAVEHDDEAAVLVIHRLAAALQVDDGQAALPQRDRAFQKLALAVRPAVGDAVHHRLQDLGRVFPRADKTNDSTHKRFLFLFALRRPGAVCAAGAEFFGVAFYLIFPYYTQFRRHCKARRHKMERIPPGRGPCHGS